MKIKKKNKDDPVRKCPIFPAKSSEEQKESSPSGADPENFDGGRQFWIRLNVNWMQRC